MDLAFQPEEQLSYGYGFVEGFFKYGLWGTVEGAATLATSSVKLGGKLVQHNYHMKFQLLGSLNPIPAPSFEKEIEFVVATGGIVKDAAEVLGTVVLEVEQLKYHTVMDVGNRRVDARDNQR